MALVVEQPIATFDLSEIARGDLVYGKHRTWPEGKAGFVTSATEKELDRPVSSGYRQCN